MSESLQTWSLIGGLLLVALALVGVFFRIGSTSAKFEVTLENNSKSIDDLRREIIGRAEFAEVVRRVDGNQQRLEGKLEAIDQFLRDRSPKR